MTKLASTLFLAFVSLGTVTSQGFGLRCKIVPENTTTCNSSVPGRSCNDSPYLEVSIVAILCVSGHNKKDVNSEKAFVRTKEYVWRQNKGYVGGATC